MSIYRPTQNSNNTSRQGNALPPNSQYHSSSNVAQAYPYNYPSRTAERSQNTAGRPQNQYDERTQEALDGNGNGNGNGYGNGSGARVETAPRKEAIHPNMQIPASVNDSGGSIGELAAKLTCFFWFEDTETLQIAINWDRESSPPVTRRLVRDAIPTSAFRKWVVTILTTTQVTPNVVLLALLFVYRLKTLNPTVKGKAGSEYRLLTVALMLGNKFLDDNTYTNKTWAEVSGISVGEIHIMEVEFLSNMRYSLLASDVEWLRWQNQVGRFAEYFERASKLPLPPSPVGSGYPALGYAPSPGTGAPPVALSLHPPNSSSEQNHQYMPGLPYNSSQTLGRPGILSRKRSYENMGLEPAPKRSATSSARQTPTGPLSNAALQRSMPRLPVPNLSISTNSNMGYAGFPQTLPPLPPMNGRAMSQVYPVTPNWTPQAQMSLPPLGVPVQYPGGGTPGATPSYTVAPMPYSLPSSNHGTPSRRHSPRSMAVHSMNSSPITASFANQDLNSPSIFLQQRNSPYKPIRPPNTLLYPPPNNSFQHHQPGIEQMHYQPLGRRNDYRTGVVPEYRGSNMGGVLYWPPPQH